jgi:hypothetical protein
MRRAPVKVPVVIVTPGAPAATAAYLRDLKIADEVEGYADPGLGLYRQLGLAYVDAKTLTSRPTKFGCGRICAYTLCFSMCCRCRCPGGSAGDWHQIGGVFVYPAGTGAAVPPAHFALKQETPGYPEMDEAAILAATDAAANGRPAPAGAVSAVGGAGAAAPAGTGALAAAATAGAI